MQNPTETGPEPDKTQQETDLKTEVSDGADGGGKASHPRPGSLERDQNAMNTISCRTFRPGLRSRSSALPALRRPSKFSTQHFPPDSDSKLCSCDHRTGALSPPARRRKKSRDRPSLALAGSNRDIGLGDRRWAECSPTWSGPEGSSHNEICSGSLSGLHLTPHFRRAAPAHCPFSDRAG